MGSIILATMEWINRDRDIHQKVSWGHFLIFYSLSAHQTTDCLIFVYIRLYISIFLRYTDPESDVLRPATQHSRYQWHKRQAKNHSCWACCRHFKWKQMLDYRGVGDLSWLSTPTFPPSFPPIFSRILFSQSIIKPSKYKVMQGKKCGVSWAAKSQPTSPCFQVQVAQALQTTYSSRGACFLVGGWERTCLACVYGMKDIFSTKMRADHSTTFNIHHLNKPLLHWMIPQLWLWRTIYPYNPFRYCIHHESLWASIKKIKEMAACVLCVCVTAKGFETNSFFIYG